MLHVIFLQKPSSYSSSYSGSDVRTADDEYDDEDDSHPSWRWHYTALGGP